MKHSLWSRRSPLILTWDKIIIHRTYTYYTAFNTLPTWAYNITLRIIFWFALASIFAHPIYSRWYSTKAALRVERRRNHIAVILIYIFFCSTNNCSRSIAVHFNSISMPSKIYKTHRNETNINSLTNLIFNTSATLTFYSLPIKMVLIHLCSYRFFMLIVVNLLRNL